MICLLWIPKSSATTLNSWGGEGSSAQTFSGCQMLDPSKSNPSYTNLATKTWFNDPVASDSCAFNPNNPQPQAFGQNNSLCS